MDVQGIDQVMIIPTDIDIYPWLQNALGAKAFCRAYNEWAYEYTQADPERLFFAALAPHAGSAYAMEEVHRVAARAAASRWSARWMRWATIRCSRSTSRCGTRLEETGMVYGMHPFPAFGTLKPPATASNIPAPS